MIDFGIWLNKHEDSFDEDCVGLFRDSYSCFKHELARPAFMLAYQGMMWHIRSILLTSTIMPEGYEEGEWEDIKKDLSNDSLWDIKVFECIQRQSKTKGDTFKAAVFPIKQDVREIFKHWKMLRNASAHYKEHDVHEAHVLTLYSFIEQYLETIVVEGGALSLARKIDDFLNPAITSPNEDMSPLIAKMGTMVGHDELCDFLDKVRSYVVKRCCCSMYCHGKARDDKQCEILHRMLHGSSVHKEGIVSYLKQEANSRIRSQYLDTYPKDIFMFFSDTAEAYKFWYNDLKLCSNKLTLLASLFRASLIKDEDTNDVIKLCLTAAEESPSGTRYDLLSDDDKGILWDRGYFKRFLQLSFDPKKLSDISKFTYIQLHTEFYVGTISIMPKFERGYVETLIAIFKPNEHPWGIRDYLKERYREDQVYREALDRVCKEESLELPKSLL